MKIAISFLLLSISGTFLKAQQPISFVPLEKGLTNNWVSTILQDSMGFIWVGTQDGLCRYDGYQFQVLRNLPDSKQSLAANWVRTMAQDKDNNFWIGTYGGGITKFSPKTMDFTNFAKDTANGFKGKLISKISPLDGGQIMGTSEAGFTIFNSADDTTSSLGVGGFNSSFTSHGDTIWLEILNNELFTYQISNQQLKPLYIFDTPIHLLKYIPELGVLVGLADKLILFRDGRIQKEIPITQKIIAVLRDGSENYLMATNSAIFKFNPRNFELVEIPTDLDLSNKRIQTIFNDKQSSLWVGTDKGLFRQKRYNPAFLNQSIQLHARRIIKNGALYVGGDMGLYKVSGGSIDLIHDQKPILALAQYGDTILTSARNAQVHRFVNDQWEKKISLSEDSPKRLAVLGLERDQNNRLWVGSWEGLFVFDKNDKLLKRFSLNNKENNREQNITNLFIDSRDRLWIITSAYGIYMLENVSLHSLDHIDENIIHYTYEEGNRNSITSNLILTIEEDDFGIIWFGTDVGVVSYNKKDDRFQRLYYHGRLFDKKIMTIRKDGSKNLWITTINDGIYVLNQVNGSMRHFTKNDGLISNAFLYGSGYYDSVKQHMYFGTDEGIQQIDLTLPFYHYENNIPILTGIQVNGEKSNLFSAFQSPFLSEISLSANQNDFSVSFSALDFIHADKIDYYYSLDNEAWKVTDLQKAYFTNLPYGNHTLKVKAVYDGIVDDSEGRQLNIYIAPPWYYSHFAKAVYVILSVVLLLLLYKYLKSRWQMQAELQLNRLEAERLKKLNDFKSQLYTDIAHEFKTPLTLISGPIEIKLKSKDLSDDDRNNFTTIKRNTNRLISLVDQLLQLAKLENGNLRLNVIKGDLGKFLQMLAHSFDYHANLREMRYAVDIVTIDEVWYDPDILEKIVSNLLSNAFKYSPEGGFCEFKATRSSDHVNIEVKNTALDVSELDLEKMFTRFYQRDEYSEGIGVGLALVKELTQFYGGNITGSIENESVITFSVRLPYHFDAFKPEDVGQNDQSFGVEKEESYRPPVNADENRHSGLPILLIAEDSAEIREFVRQSMREKYQILGAENGEIALKTALKYVPDIVLSDIRMPVMDGVELCNTLKTDERTSHIPVILLTAGASEEHELKGLSSGADVFLTKPFKVAILEQHITNLIDLRRVLHERYRNEFLLKPHKIALTSTDEVFLNKVKEVMDSELSNSDFNATTFSKMVNMSRMQLHRKLLAYTGLSTTAFIRSQRLQQAIHILETSDATVNEVAYAVGFNTPSYFMKCFKETFKKTPSEYLSTKQPS